MTTWAGTRERRVVYAALWIFALAFGWIEASTVVYLREISAQAAWLEEANDVAGLPVTLVSLPTHLIALEMLREGCTIILLGSVAWVAGRSSVDRAGVFLLSFGIWDLTYYAALKLGLGWPNSLSAWDVLFLIPLPWVAPVWAPVTAAMLFVAAGSRLFWTAERERRYHWPDIGVVSASIALTIFAFLTQSAAALDQREPERFPAWLFGAGVALGIFWFVQAEWRAAIGRHRRKPWAGVRVRTIVPEPSHATDQAGLGDVVAEYEKAKTRLDALVREADDVGERLERLAQGLLTHPARLIIGFPDRFIEDPTQWDIAPSHPLPSMERLAALTNEIREVGRKVEDLAERLILRGRADLVERHYRFFH